MSECTKEQFLSEITKHKMEIIVDTDKTRHLVFRDPSNCNMWFQLNTWNQHLCISGDMGTFVFSRVEDMFRFFRRDKLSIHTGYWSEKLQSISIWGGKDGFSMEVYREYVEEHIEEYIADNELDDDYANELKADAGIYLYSEVGSEESAYMALQEFEFKGDSVFDTCDGVCCKEYSYQYIWCLYAIVWGIYQYDNRDKA